MTDKPKWVVSGRRSLSEKDELGNQLAEDSSWALRLGYLALEVLKGRGGYNGDTWRMSGPGFSLSLTDCAGLRLEDVQKMCEQRALDVLRESVARLLGALTP